MESTDDKSKNDLLISNKGKTMHYIESLTKDIKKLTYEESIAELEVILANVQDENISLDKIQKNYIKGHILLKHCEELLEFVEQEINEIDPDFLNID